MIAQRHGKPLSGRWLAALAAALLSSATALAGNGEGILKIDLDDIAPAAADVAAGQPSEAALAKLAEQGYVAVIDLRGPGENRGYDEAARAEELGLGYTPLPVTGADDVSLEKARELGELLDHYDGPVLVHCGSANRVGALVALLEADRGASVEDAIAAGRAAGLTRMEGLVRERIAEGGAETP